MALGWSIGFLFYLHWLLGRFETRLRYSTSLATLLGYLTTHCSDSDCLRSTYLAASKVLGGHSIILHRRCLYVPEIHIFVLHRR